VFEVSPSDHSDFCVSVHVVEAYAIWGTGTNSKQQTTISETENVKRRLKSAATFLKKAKLRFAATD